MKKDEKTSTAKSCHASPPVKYQEHDSNQIIDNPALKILSSGVTGTTAMTAYSYLTSQSRKKQFREPEILAKLIKRLLPETAKDTTRIEGWMAHYAVGFSFATAYHVVWQKTKIKPGILSGLVAGALSGLIGIIVWKKVFAVHPYPPGVDRANYYKHLFAAHLVFGMFSALGYLLPRTGRHRH